MAFQTSVSAFRKEVEHSTHITIVTHQNPDGDAMGSALGLSDVFTRMGKTNRVITPNSYPAFLSWMWGSNQTINFESSPNEAKKWISECDLIIMVDFNSTKRAKGMTEILDQSKAYKMMIDHHPEPDHRSANLIISNTQVSSTCELAYGLIRDSGLKEYLSVKGANCLYAGIMTDTNMLSHNSSRPATYHIVADLVSMGIDKDEILKQVFHSNSLSRMRLLGYCLYEKMQILESSGAAYIALSAEELARFNFQPGDTEGFVNYPLGIEGINISALFMEKDNVIKVSLRSRGEIAVNKISELYFNGGGHLNAAGGESLHSMEHTIQVFKEALVNLLN